MVEHLFGASRVEDCGDFRKNGDVCDNDGFWFEGRVDAAAELVEHSRSSLNERRITDGETDWELLISAEVLGGSWLSVDDVEPLIPSASVAPEQEDVFTSLSSA